jgi:hypothetical protein
LRRFVICVDLNDLDQEYTNEELKWLEFPILLIYWYLAGHIPIAKLDDCLCAGWVKVSGEIYQCPMDAQIDRSLRKILNPVEMKQLKYICLDTDYPHDFWSISPERLLEHIPSLNFCRV